VEDQQPDPGDLTNAESPDQPADVELPAQPGDTKTPTGKAARRRHRMPLRQELVASREDGEQTQSDAAGVTETSAVEQPRRTGLFRRRAKAAESEPGSASTDEDAPADDRILVPHRPAGKRLTIAAVAAGVVFVGAAAFAGATLQPYLADRALVNTKLDIARTAANGITTLWTYTPDNMDKLPDRSAGYLGGEFANEYRKYIDAIVAPNKQAQVTNTTQVMGTAVETVTPTEATALVYTNSVATSPVSKNIPSLRYLSYRLTLQRHQAKWLITRMSTVTSFDLTPKL